MISYQGADVRTVSSSSSSSSWLPWDAVGDNPPPFSADFFADFFASFSLRHGQAQYETTRFLCQDRFLHQDLLYDSRPRRYVARRRWWKVDAYISDTCAIVGLVYYVASML